MITEKTLPLGYQKVEYIINSNRTYIDTGIYLSSSDHIICNFRDETKTARNRFLFGTSSPADKRIWANNYHGYNAGSTIYPRFGSLASNNYYNSGGTGTTNIGKVEIENKIWKFGGTSNTYDASSGGDFDCENPCTLFGRSSSESYDSSDICIARFFVEGKFDGYACINPHGEAGLFDFVSMSFFKSPDNIPFVAGPVILNTGQFANIRRNIMMEKSDIIMTQQSNAPFLALCYEKGLCAHESYMTKREAEAVKTISGDFLYYRDDVLSVEELRYFSGFTTTNVSRIFGYARNCLVFCCPPNMATLGSDALRRWNSGEWIVLGPKTKSILQRNIYQWRQSEFAQIDDRASFILMSDTVVSLNSNNVDGQAAVHRIYVPDKLINSYKADEVWGATYADRIVGISTLPSAQRKYLDWYNYKIE